MDKTIIKDLLIRGVIGISESERSQRQDILVNLTLFGDARTAGHSDFINDCINYRTVAKKIIAFVERSARFTVEALCADIARICLEEPGVDGALVRVEKPGAVRFAKSVGVEIERWRDQTQAKNHQLYVSLGSNIDPEINIIAAIEKLRQMVTVYALSSIWESPSAGSPGPNFLNVTTWISTPLTKAEFKEQVIQPIEQELGRVRNENKNAARTIDLDLLVMDDVVMDEDLWSRDYLAIPTAELRPDLVEPRSEKNLASIAQRIRTNSSILQRKDLRVPSFQHPTRSTQP